MPALSTPRYSHKQHSNTDRLGRSILCVRLPTDQQDQVSPVLAVFSSGHNPEPCGAITAPVPFLAASRHSPQSHCNPLSVGAHYSAACLFARRLILARGAIVRNGYSCDFFNSRRRAQYSALMALRSSIVYRFGSCWPSSHSTLSAPIRRARLIRYSTTLPLLWLLHGAHCLCTFSASKRNSGELPTLR